MNEFVWTVVADRVRKLAFKGKRLDGRPLTEYRPISVKTGFVHHADASAMVSIGNTKVVAGVKFEVGSPFPDRPGEGTIITDAELLPMASPIFEPGPPDENAIELARVVDRSIRESGAIDWKSLGIDDENVWLIFIDIRVLDADGNLFDAAQFAAVKALSMAKIPKFEDGQIIRGEYDRPLEIKEIPVLTTFAKIGPLIVVDPSLEEEKAMDARFSVATVGDDLCAIQKGHGGRFTPGEIESMVDTAFKKAKEVRKILRGE